VQGNLGCLSNAFALNLEVEGEWAEDDVSFDALVDVVGEGAQSYKHKAFIEVIRGLQWFGVEGFDIRLEELVTVAIEEGLDTLKILSQLLDDLDIVEGAHSAQRHQQLEGVRFEYLRDAGAHDLFNSVCVHVEVQCSLHLHHVNRQEGLEGTDNPGGCRILEHLSEHFVELRPQIDLDAKFETLKQLRNDGLSLGVEDFGQGSLKSEVKLDALLAIFSSEHLVDRLEHRVRLFQFTSGLVIFVDEKVEEERRLFKVRQVVNFELEVVGDHGLYFIEELEELREHVYFIEARFHRKRKLGKGALLALDTASEDFPDFTFLAEGLIRHDVHLRGDLKARICACAFV